MSTRTQRLRRATAILPLALLSAAWTVNAVGVGGDVLPTISTAALTPPTTLPDGSSVPGAAIEVPATVTSSGDVAPGLAKGSASQIVSTAYSAGIPAAALAAYQRAETVIDSADRSCNITWQLIAAVGRVESDHGRADGNALNDKGIAQPGIYGPVLNGKAGTSVVRDTDGGQYDNDTSFDRAVGPMQFIPSTWSVVGVDADGDGRRNPQDINDAALGTAVYLCSGSGDLSTTAGQKAAVYRYNHSTAYVNLVLSVMRGYLSGDFTSVPNGVSAAGYLAPSHSPGRGHHGGLGVAHHHHGAQTGGTLTSPTTTPSSTPSSVPSSAPSQQPTQAPTHSPSPHPTQGPTHGGGNGGGHPGPLPSTGVTIPPVPSTSVKPIDHLLSQAQAVLQCTLDGYLDNPLKSDDPFDQCVAHYTTAGAPAPPKP